MIALARIGSIPSLIGVLLAAVLIMALLSGSSRPK